MSDLILVLNAGSSSIKFEMFTATQLQLRWAGQVEGIGAAPHFIARDQSRRLLAEHQWRRGEGPCDHATSLDAIIDWLDTVLCSHRVIAVGHRVVHGGPDLAAPAMVDAALLQRLAALSPLAPLHQPHNLAGLAAAAAHFPGVPQVACFDTAFHQGRDWEATCFALPEEFYRRGIRRYGFHGLSYEFIVRRLAEEDPALAEGRIIIAHLGNGASLCAVKAGRSVDSTMGFTALDGVPMGTRCGQIDPGVLLYLLEEEGMTSSEITRLLYKESGLKGLSGISQDVRELEASDDRQAAGALSYFAWRIRREVGALAAVMGGVDALVFTAGIGENAPKVRAAICDQLGFLGIGIEPERNARGMPLISPEGAKVPVLVRRTDEERMIAEHVREVLAQMAPAVACFATSPG